MNHRLLTQTITQYKAKKTPHLMNTKAGKMNVQKWLRESQKSLEKGGNEDPDELSATLKKQGSLRK